MSEPSDLYPAAISRSPTGRMALSVAGMDLGEERNLAEAMHRLCTYAINQQIQMVATIKTGAGTRYMAIDRSGIATPSAAPATTLFTTALPPEGPRNLGTAATDVDTTRIFVERFILDPTADQKTGPPPKRRRIGFGKSRTA